MCLLDIAARLAGEAVRGDVATCTMVRAADFGNGKSGLWGGDLSKVLSVLRLAGTPPRGGYFPY